MSTKTNQQWRSSLTFRLIAQLDGEKVVHLRDGNLGGSDRIGDIVLATIQTDDDGTIVFPGQSHEA